MTVNRSLERADRPSQADLRDSHVGHERQQLAYATCICGAPLRLHFASLVVGRGVALGCAVARHLWETGR